MDVTVAGRAERLDVAVSYELRVPADDPLLPLLASGRVDGADLGEYLAYGPVNTPVTVERSAGSATPAASRSGCSSAPSTAPPTSQPSVSTAG